MEQKRNLSIVELPLKVLGVALVHILLANLTHWTAFRGGELRLFWPAPAFAIFAIAVFGSWAITGIGLGAFIHYWWVMSAERAGFLALLGATGATVVMLSGVLLFVFWMKRWLGQIPERPSKAHFSKFILINVLVSWVFPFATMAGLRLAVLPVPGSLVDPWLAMYVGAAVSNLVILPVLLVANQWKNKHMVSNWLPLVILGVGVGVTLMLTLGVHFREQETLEMRFDSAAENVRIVVQQSLQLGYHDLNLLAKFFRSSEEVTREEFREFTAPFLSGDRRTSGLVSLHWIPVVTREERAALEADAVRQGVTGFNFLNWEPDGKYSLAEERDVYYPVYFSENGESSDQMLGLDLGTVAIFLDRLDAASRIGGGTVLECSLFCDGEKGDKYFLVVLPVFELGQDEPAGFVGGVFRMEEWISSAVDSLPAIGRDKYIFEEKAPSGEQLLFAAIERTQTETVAVDPGLTAESLAEGIFYQAPLYFLDANWLLIIKPAPKFLAENTSWMQWLVLASGLVITLIISLSTAENHKMIQALRDSREQYQLLAENVSDVIWTYDVDEARLMYVSPSVEGLLGIAADEILEKHLEELITPRSLDYLQKAGGERLAAFLAGDVSEYQDEIEMFSRGAIIWVEISARVMKNQRNNHVELYGVSRNISGRKKAEETLQQREALLQAAQRLSKLGGWEWDVEQESMYWTAEVFRIHGLDPEKFPYGSSELVEKSLACYDEPGRQAILDAFRRCVGEGIAYDLIVPFTTVVGEKLWVRTTAEARQEGGKVVKVIGNLMDITDHKKVEEALKEQESILQKIFELLPIGLWFADKNGKLIRGNPMGVKIWGAEPKVDISEYGVFKARRLPSGEEIAADDWALAHTITEGMTITDELLEIEAFDGKKKIVLNYTTPVLDEAGEILGAIIVNQDVTESKRMEKMLEEERNSLARRVAERTADLQHSNTLLEEALKAKDAFLANMSHELRTPLTAILGLSELLTTQAYGDLNERQQKYLTTIEQSGQHLLALINDILDLAKAGAGKLDLMLEMVVVEDVCQASLAFIRTIAEKKNVQVAYVQVDQNLVVAADARRLRQILINLLNNAVKFTPQGGQVSLVVEPDEEAGVLSFTVYDTGIGISAEDKGKLFQPFTQLDSGLDREFEGSGLGLALVHRLVDLHQGSIAVESEGIPGKGSKFIVKLPWKGDLIASKIKAGLYTGGEGGEIKDGMFDARQRGVILLAEDNEANRLTIVEYLRKTGYEVIEACNGQEAVDLAKAYSPDLIVMDIFMPVMDGLAAIQSLRQVEGFAKTPILALTALVMPEDKERCLKAGADEVLTKPVHLRVLTDRLAALLKTGKAEL
jgi:PAS domain S-box-containing protein